MKKVLLLMSIIFIFNLSLLKAQTEQGKFVLGGSSTFGLMGTGNDIMNIGFSTIKYKSDADGFEEPDADKLTSVNFLPKVGIFAANNFLIGIDISLAYQKNEDGENDYTYTNRLISAGPFLRYYIPTNSIKPFIEASSSFGTIKSKYEDEFDSDEDKESLLAIGGGFGMAIPIGSKASFDIMAHYTSFSMKNTEDNQDNNRIVVGTLGLKLGFVVFLGY